MHALAVQLKEQLQRQLLRDRPLNFTIGVVTANERLSATS